MNKKELAERKLKSAQNDYNSANQKGFEFKQTASEKLEKAHEDYDSAMTEIKQSLDASPQKPENSSYKKKLKKRLK